MTSDQLNEAIRAIEHSETYSIQGLSEHGKRVPYIGWYWRDVDFDAPIRLGDCGSFVGFMENNKWDYPEWTVSEHEDAEIKRRIRDIAQEPTEPKLQGLFDYIQSIRREFVSCQTCDGRGYFEQPGGKWSPCPVCGYAGYIEKAPTVASG